MNFLSGKKKILTMILGVVSGLAIAFGLDQNETSVVSGAVVSVVSVISYMIAEGKIDLARITEAANKVNDVIELVDEINPIGFDVTTEGGDVDVQQTEGN